jgi:S1-C subfamily serine protease
MPFSILTARPSSRAFRRVWLALLATLCLGLRAPVLHAAESPPLSQTARSLYDAAKPRLLQIRVVLKAQGNQAGAGSGFVVAGGRIVSNYHVVAQAALEPDKYRLVYSGVDGKEGALKLLAIDVRRDLAVLGFDTPPKTLTAFDWASAVPRQGDRLYSLGNPLDIGFAVVEGTYNGVPPRAFYPQLLFTGAINPGMSGGPVLDRDGRVVGINVAKRTDGELVSFLVPATFAQALAAQSRADRPLKLPAHAEVARQLLAHQQTLVARTLAKPLRQQTHGRWKVPLLDETWARCWGSPDSGKHGALGVERSDCTMDTAIFTGLGNVGGLSLRHEVYDGSELGAWRFAAQYSQSLANERFPSQSTKLTALRCQDGFVAVGKLPLRGIVCARAHKKFAGLYDFSVLAMTVDAPTAGVQGRLDATGVSFASGVALARHYLGGYAWVR